CSAGGAPKKLRAAPNHRGSEPKILNTEHLPVGNAPNRYFNAPNQLIAAPLPQQLRQNNRCHIKKQALPVIYIPGRACFQ
ncbi:MULTISPECIES: hypothetical protein, partial [unclassified Sporosarcina]|uniref:hypothetical protein n=1 Tax=unclassified Sporosarcina TaxID=2647733 RepID=UPI00203B5057